MDFILNGLGSGSLASKLVQNNFQTGTLRPYSIDGRGTYITINEGGKEVPQLISNATATLRKEDWVAFDTAIIKAAKPRLNLVAKLRQRGLTYGIANGLGKTVLQTQSQSDISGADVSMNGVRKTAGDRPVYDLTNLPLPIVHKDFTVNARELAASRNSGSPLDTSTAELAGRRVAEGIENLAIGTSGQYSYGGGSVYGLINFPDRLTQTMTLPSHTGWTPATLVSEVLTMRQKSTDAFYFGPWVLFVSPSWDKYLDEDYSTSKGDNTLRERIGKIRGIESVETLDYLTGFQMVLVQMTSDVVREVVGMDIQTLQWETEGGMELHFKVMSIQVPQIRSDFNKRTGIVHGVGA